MSAECDRGRCGLAGLAVLVLGAACGGGSAAPPSDGAITGDRGSDGGVLPADPNDHAITINEIMSRNALSAVDDTGAAVPWIELFNPTSGNISLHGYALTDDFSQPQRAVLPEGAVVPAGGYLVLWCDGRPSAGPASSIRWCTPNSSSALSTL